ncbi:MAG: RIP metalloprotease RseP [Cycloclasticus sp.]|nr:MAG: RIP metalloprotease RseP [Colwellia sp. Phe_37]MBV1913503.1 RIP metalloprotease RseP [Cycloclasticus sp.]MEE4290369.1 RIP metalloprotease RseP [Cycloclasticus sp.]
MSIIISILSFALVLGILVTVHEFGHFWVARRCGVKVLRFSVGFGKPLFKFKRKNDPTEYVIAGIPLGGYVKMLDENEGSVDEAEKDQAFNNKPLFSKFLIVLAGPVFNFIFAFFAFWAILTIGEDGLKPVIGELEKTGIAIHSGLEVGDEIVAINDRPVAIWRVAIGLMASEMMDSGVVELSVIKPGGGTDLIPLQFDANRLPEPSDIVKQIGILPRVPTLKPIVGKVINGEPGDLAGLKQGDLILSANGAVVESWRHWVDLTRSSPNVAMSILVLREGERVALTVTPKKIIDNEVAIGRIGISPLVDKDVSQSFYTTYKLSGFSAISEAATQTISYSVLTVKLIGRMLIGEASVQNLSGPISLAQYAGQTATIGLIPFLKFLAFVSVSLGVMNLLPIPMLDGGHLFFYVIEAIKGKPVSDRTQGMCMRVGMFVLLCMMVLAVFIDIGRIIG